VYNLSHILATVKGSVSVISLIHPYSLHSPDSAGNENKADIQILGVVTTDQHLDHPPVLYANLNNLEISEGQGSEGRDFSISVIPTGTVGVLGPAQAHAGGRGDESLRKPNVCVVEVHTPKVVPSRVGVKHIPAKIQSF
jgi:hypothetical protein